MNYFNPNYGKDHPNSPSFEGEPDYRTPIQREADEAELREAHKRHIAQSQELVDAALERIDRLMKPLRDWQARSAHWDRARAALARRDYAAYDAAMADFRRVQ